jgi:hypothetical protein
VSTRLPEHRQTTALRTVAGRPASRRLTVLLALRTGIARQRLTVGPEHFGTSAGATQAWAAKNNADCHGKDDEEEHSECEEENGHALVT